MKRASRKRDPEPELSSQHRREAPDGCPPADAAHVATPPTQVTELLAACGRGEEGAFDRLVEIAYDELRRVGKGQRWGGGQTLQTTALVHEAWLKMVDQKSVTWEDRNHFYGVAARAMRQILVDHARRRLAVKRGAGAHHTSIDGLDVAEQQSAEEVLAVHQALASLADLGDRLVRVVELRYFAGFTIEETAELLGVGTRTVERDWQKARAWLEEELAR